MKKNIISLLLLLRFNQYGICQEIFSIKGTVTDAVTKEPLNGAVVNLKEENASATCDEDGNFVLETKIKRATVIVQLAGYKTYERKVEFPYEPVKIELELSTDFTMGKVYVKDKFKIEGSKHKVKSEQIKKATTHLFSDSMKILQTLPGVVTGDDFSSLMYIRGGEFYESVSFLDNIYIGFPYMWGGSQSVFNPSFVDKIDFYSGGFPVKYQQALSGVIDVKNIEGNYEKHSGFVDLSPTTFELFSEGPMNKDKSSYVIGIRRTYYDFFMNLAYGDKYEGIVFPFFYDTQSKFTWKLNDKDKIYVNFMGSYEGMDFNSKAASESTDSSHEEFKFKYSDMKILPAINWERVQNDRLSFNLTFSNKYQEGNNKFSNIDVNGESIYKQYEFFLRSRVVYLTGSHSIEQGLYFFEAPVYVRSDYKYRTLMPDGTYYYDEDINKLDWTKFFASGIYLQDDVALVSDKLFLNIGGVFEYLEYTKDNTFCPRGGIKYLLTDNTTLKFNTGLYTQFPIASMTGSPPVVENTKIDSEKAIHYILGVEQELPSNFFFRVETFVKEYKDRAISDPDPNLKYTNNGKRTSQGFDVFLQRKIVEKWDGWLAYTYLDSKDKILERSNPSDFIGKSSLDYSEPIGVWYTSQLERKHNLSLVLNYDISNKYKLAATYRFSTGTPYTPVIGATRYGDDVYVPVYGGYNSERMPDYMRCDVKLTMPFFGLKNFESYIQIINLFGNENVDRFFYSDDYSKKYKAKMLPFIPIGGIKYSF